MVRSRKIQEEGRAHVTDPRTGVIPNTPAGHRRAFLTVDSGNSPASQVQATNQEGTLLISIARTPTPGSFPQAQQP